ncbi:tetratricopeptide repeat protein [Variovorax guangxiensis]|uniref:Tetratricopeptide (TPR) repeat protein n=1 Tax=Variovorax guangxiensis TaxID=1775474 RepID=A0A840GA56_9BURK|nr:tetratricopeptide repeat protein [Variovorax guangxiensis]MBB4225718.1 tetratricopeptide (TPR) repeat protein [Variovorax guangxiensis]
MRLALFSSAARAHFSVGLLLAALTIVTNASAADSSPADSAIETAQKNLDRAERLYGPNEQRTAHALYRLAEAYRAHNQKAAAIPLLTRALSILDRTKSPDPFVVVQVLNDLGLNYAEQNQLREALPLLQRSLDVAETYYRASPNHSNLITLTGNVAGAYSRLGEPAEAEKLYRRMLSMSEKAFGTDDPRTAKIRGDLYEQTQRLAGQSTINRGNENGSRSTGMRVVSMDCESMKRTVISTKIPPNASITASNETVMFMTKAVLDMIAAKCPTEPGVTAAQIEAERQQREQQYAAAERACNAVQSGGRKCIPQAHTATAAASAPPVASRASNSSQSGTIAYDPVTGKCYPEGSQECKNVPGTTSDSGSSGSSGRGIRTAR